MKKGKILAIFLISAFIGSFMLGFLPTNTSISPFNNLSSYFQNIENPPQSTEPGNPINPTPLENDTLNTLDQYTPPAYTGSGRSYNTITEQFVEIVKYGTTATWTGSNVNVPTDSGYPSQAASKVYLAISRLIENHNQAINAPFTGGSMNGFTNYTYPQGNDGADTYTLAPGEYFRLAFEGNKYTRTDYRYGNDIYFGSSGWSQTARNLGQYWDTGGFANPDTYTPNGYQVGYWRSFTRTTGTTVTDHDIWCGNTYTYTPENAAVNWVNDNDGTFTHGLNFAAADSGYNLLQARIHLNFNIHSTDYDDPLNDYRLAVRYEKNGVWSSWNIVTEGTTVTTNANANWYWDITSAVASTSASTTWKLSWRFTANPYSSNGGDPEEIYCDIDDFYLTLNYEEAETFNPNTRAQIHQDNTYWYDKDTISGNLTYQYRLPTDWATYYANSRANLRIYMSSSAQSVPVGNPRYVFDQPLNTFTADGAWHSRSWSITADLGLSGQIDSFYFEFEVYWSMGTAWGPLTNNLLYFDIDYVNFNFDANVRPDNIGFYFIDTSDSSEYTIGGTYGQGTIDWTKSYGAAAAPVYQFKINNSWVTGAAYPWVSAANVQITYGALNMTESAPLTATSTYSASANATNINWYLSYTSCSKNDVRTDGSEMITISGVPTDYTGVSINPNSHNEQIISAPAGTLKVNGSHSNTIYTLTATAPNYLKNDLDAGRIRVQENSSGTFVDTSVVYPSNWTRVKLNAQAQGYVNLTIVNASRIGIEATWNTGREYNELLLAALVGFPQVNSTPWKIPDNSIPGIWTVILVWNNSLLSTTLDEVGMVSIPLDMRRRTNTTGVIFGKQIKDVIDAGNSSLNAVNRTLDGDPLSINITWTDIHWAGPVTYHEKAYINITGDSAPFDDLPPFTVVQKNLTRIANIFYYKITASDYVTWCYTGQHNFTIVLQSESTLIDGDYKVKYITGSFYVITDISMMIDPTSSLTEPPSTFYQGEMIQLKISLNDISHGNVEIRNNTPADPWYGLVRANWSLALEDQYSDFTQGNPLYPGNGSLEVFGVTYYASVTINPACVPKMGANYYYFNFTAELLKNVALNWEAEITICKNGSLPVDPQPYTMPKWGRINVEEALNTWASGAQGGRNNSNTHTFDIGLVSQPIDYYWWSYGNDSQLLYVHFYNASKSIYGGFVNSTYYNSTLQYEGNNTYLRADWSGYPAGDIKIISRTTGGFEGECNWSEAIPRWQNDISDIRYAKVPEITVIGNTTSYTGNLTDWSPTNNLTWGWYYHNFTIHDNEPDSYFVSVECRKGAQYWLNESYSGAYWKWKPSYANLFILVKPNPINFVIVDNSLIAKGYGADADRFDYYWGDILTLNITAWDILNNYTDPINGVIVTEINVYYKLQQQGIGEITVPDNTIPNRTTGENYYNNTLNTTFVNNEQTHLWFEIYGQKANYSVSHSSLLYLRYDFDLETRPTSLIAGVRLGLFSNSRTTEDILEINKLLSFNFGDRFYIPVNRTFTLTVNFTDDSPRDSGPINDAVTFVNITDTSKTNFFLSDNPIVDITGENGVYNFTIDTTGLDIKQTYAFTITAQKQVSGVKNYKAYTFQQNIKDITVKTMPVPVVMAQSYLFGANYFPVQGQTMRVVVKLEDPTTGNLLSGAVIWYSIIGPDINPFIPIQGPMIEISPGYYIFELDTWTGFLSWRPGGTYIFEAKVMGFAGDSAGMYGTYLDYRSAMFATSDNSALYINVASYGPLGPMTSSMLIGLIGAIVVGGVYSTYQVVKLLSVPYAFRKIEETIKKVKRRRKTFAGVMKSREQQVVEEAETKLSVLGVKLEPISAKKLPPPITKVIKKKELGKELPLLTEEQIKAELDAIKELTGEEKMLFLKEIKGLSSHDQREFIAGLKGESKEGESKKGEPKGSESKKE